MAQSGFSCVHEWIRSPMRAFLLDGGDSREPALAMQR